jgi:hypothetical protein
LHTWGHAAHITTSACSLPAVKSMDAGYWTEDSAKICAEKVIDA